MSEHGPARPVPASGALRDAVGPVAPPSVPIPVVHPVTTDEVVSDPEFLTRAGRVMAALGPRGALHLRAPRLAVRELYRLAEALTSLQGETGCWLVVVDRVDVAAGAGARGVQLTSQSVSVADARRVAPTLAAGASVHSEAEAGGAAADGAAWVVASDIHAPRAPLVAGAALDRARAVVRRAAPVPVIVIGGVLPAHVAPLRSTGVYGVAVIRGIWEAENAERAATDYLSAHDAQGAA